MGGVSTATAMNSRNRPADIAALSILFLLLAVVCGICVASLTVPADEPHPFLRMFPALILMGTNSVSWLVFVGMGCVAAAVGLWRCTHWGFLTGTVVLVLFLAMHFLRAMFTHQWWEMVPIVLMGVLTCAYLRRRAYVFAPANHRTLSNPGEDLPRR